MSDPVYLQIFTRGLEADLDGTSIEDGKLRYTTDTGKLFLDMGNGVSGTRIKIGDTDESYTQAQILQLQNPLPKLYIASDTGRGFFYVGSSWIDLGSVVLSASAVDADNVLWFSPTSGSQPNYQADLKYNPSTRTLKTPNAEISNQLTVNGMHVSVATNADTSHTVTFSFS